MNKKVAVVLLIFVFIILVSLFFSNKFNLLYPSEKEISNSKEIVDSYLNKSINEIVDDTNLTYVGYSNITRCYIGQHNWKIDEDFDEYCRSDVAHYYVLSEKDIQAELNVINKNLKLIGWANESQRELGSYNFNDFGFPMYEKENFREFKYAGRRGKETSLHFELINKDDYYKLNKNDQAYIPKEILELKNEEYLLRILLIQTYFYDKKGKFDIPTYIKEPII